MNPNDKIIVWCNKLLLKHSGDINKEQILVELKTKIVLLVEAEDVDSLMKEALHCRQNDFWGASCNW